ncbi:hypothetical protein K438DRAFT_434583 [Mycena galopus ATCC 62051]|nr:hypothetical protein K438DRAFT_434583 [Mycena galopus ATCC 62051]
MPPQGLTNFNDTGLSTTLRYGTGANFVTGDIGISAFQLDGGEFTVPQQGMWSFVLFSCIPPK